MVRLHSIFLLSTRSSSDKNFGRRIKIYFILNIFSSKGVFCCKLMWKKNGKHCLVSIVPLVVQHTTLLRWKCAAYFVWNWRYFEALLYSTFKTKKMCRSEYLNSRITTPVFSQNPQQFQDTFNNSSRTFHITGAHRRHLNIFVEIWNIFWCIFKSTTQGTTEYCKSEFHLCIFIDNLLAWSGPCGLRKLRLPEFVDNRRMKVEMSSILDTGHLYPYDTSLVLISVTGRVDPGDALRPKVVNK